MQASQRHYSLAALLTLACALIMSAAFGAPYAMQTLQPTLPDAHNADFYQAVRETPRAVLAFMATDTLFIFGYLTIFIGLYEQARARRYTLATIALIFGLAAGIFDLLENSYLTTYALQSLYAHPLDKPALPLIYILASMKWLCGFFTLFLYALAWKKETGFDWAFSGIMLLFPILGAFSIAIPEALAIRPLPLVVLMVMVGWYFWRVKN